MTIEMDSIKEKVKSFIVERTFVNHDKIQFDSLVFKDGYLDSMGFVSLLTFIEKEFKTKTVDADLVEENFESINAISDFIVKKSLNQ
jgi:acyl carrier protein